MRTISPVSIDGQGRPRRGRCRRTTTALLALVFLLTIGCHSFNLLFPERQKTEEKVAETGPAVRPQADAPCKYSLYIRPYVFLSDFEIQRDLPLFRELEGLRDQVSRELQLPPGNEVIQVYLFRDRPSYKEFMLKHHRNLPDRRAFFILKQSSMGGSDLIVYAYQDTRIQQDLRHELTHALLHSVLKDVPICWTRDSPSTSSCRGRTTASTAITWTTCAARKCQSSTTSLAWKRFRKSRT